MSMGGGRRVTCLAADPYTSTSRNEEIFPAATAAVTAAAAATAAVAAVSGGAASELILSLPLLLP